jgi:hypothetical protein
MREEHLTSFVSFNEPMENSIIKHPILRLALLPDKSGFLSAKMNEILNKSLIPFKAKLTSYTINVFLNEYYKIRGSYEKLFR